MWFVPQFISMRYEPTSNADAINSSTLDVSLASEDTQQSHVGLSKHFQHRINANHGLATQRQL